MRPFLQSVAGNLRASAVARAREISQTRSETRTALARQRNARLRKWQAMRRSLQVHRAAMIEALRSTQASAGTAAAVPAESAVPGTEATERVGVWELWSEPTHEPDATRGEPLHAEVLRTIQAHPEGVRALDLGNELGVDWRRVLVVALDLIDAGVVEQVEQEFYPVAKASGRW